MECPECKIENDKIICKGRIATSGCVTGIARIAMNPVEIKKILKEEILVTPMTDPASVPEMQIAGAVITDRGGMLCHAAIVCREINKPCIVGTRSATSTIKPGSKIRVCANTGTIYLVD